MTQRAKRPLDPFSTAVLAYLVPGAGHLALGRRAKAALYFTLILGVLVAGWLISGRENVYLDRGRWHFLVQMGAGAATWVVGMVSRAPEPERTVMHTFEIGTLYTMVAGLLNVLVIMDAVMTSLRARRTSR